MLDALQHGRLCYERRRWNEAYQALLFADQATPLDVDDLERLATSAYLIGALSSFSDFSIVSIVLHLEAGDQQRAARCAFWLAPQPLASRRRWASRTPGSREGSGSSQDRDCVERGYLLLAAADAAAP